jgi:hypothetical protein
MPSGLKSRERAKEKLLELCGRLNRLGNAPLASLQHELTVLLNDEDRWRLRIIATLKQRFDSAMATSDPNVRSFPPSSLQFRTSQPFSLDDAVKLSTMA